MYHIYLLRSISHPSERYIGFTTDVAARLDAHNRGQSPHTAKHKPWDVVATISFPDKGKALAFESYLKSGSGRAFANKRFW